MPLDPLLSIFLFPLIWLIIVYSCKMFSGWAILEKNFIFSAAYTDKLINPILVRIGIFKYSGLVSFGCSSQGLYVKPSVMIQPFHKPLLIPWHKISFSWEDFMLIKYGVFTVNTDKQIKIKIGSVAAEKILQAYNIFSQF